MPLRGKNWHIIGKIYHFNQSYIVSGPGQGWGWLGLGGCCTLPVGLRPCSGGNSRWSPRNLKPFANDSRGYRGPNKRGLFSGLHFGPLRDWPYSSLWNRAQTSNIHEWKSSSSWYVPSFPLHTSTSKDKISIRQELLRVVACRAARLRLT